MEELNIYKNLWKNTEIIPCIDIEQIPKWGEISIKSLWEEVKDNEYV